MPNIHHLFKYTKALRLKIDGANYELTAGTGDSSTSGVVDTEGFDGVAFILACGAFVANATGALKLQGSPDNNADFVDVANSHVNLVQANADQLAIIDVFRPTQRYLQTVLTRAGGANSAYDSLIVLLFRAEYTDTVQDATTVATVNYLTGPVAGTA